VPESQSFADFIGTREQTLHLIDDAIIRADTLQKPWAVSDLKQLKSSVEALPKGTKKDLPYTIIGSSIHPWKWG
jgi:hypothetical protein